MSDGTPPPPPPGQGPGGQDPQQHPGQNPYGGQSGSIPPPPPPPGGGPGGPPGYGMPAPPPLPQGAVGSRPGELGERFLARLLDSLLLAVVNAIIVGFVIVGAIFGSSGGFGFGAAGDWAASAVAAVLSTAIYLAYFAIMDSTQGRTIGKMVMKLRVVGKNGGNPTVEESLKRNCWMALSLLGVVPIIGGLVGGVAQLVAVILIAVGISNDTVRRQAWHDKFAETQVLKDS